LKSKSISRSSHTGLCRIPKDQQQEGVARRFLVPLLLEEIERFPDLVVEGYGDHLVLFRPRKILEPAAFPRFQDELRTLARLFPGEMQIR
jgi:hypothetical protein